MIVGIGVDLVEIDRAHRMLESLGERMLMRLFSEIEAEYIRSRAAPAQHAAVRLAAKEAAFKALAGNDLARGITWREVEVVNASDGAPALMLAGRAAERAAELGVTRIHVSLTHERGMAAAVVLLEAASPSRDGG
ncbi:MAG TPA: holo-ACP synthase [Gemmatimonadaceae bacterium]|nr:holo-ACP synthase [Gemmatimonadaceae bacterium]